MTTPDTATDGRITVAEAASRAGVVPRTVRSWLTKGYLTRHRAPDGYHVRVDTAELGAFLDDRALRYPDGSAGL